VSLVSTIRARRRRMELLHGFVAVSAVFLLGGVVTGVIAGVAPVDTEWRIRLVSAEVLALTAWLGLALLGHAHKVVPFIVWTKLRTSGQLPSGGKPVLFGDLFRAGAARLTFVLVTAGFALAFAGVLSSTAALFGAGALLAGLAGAVALWNLGTGPRRALRLRAS
jgi:hypothetical protein